MKRILLNLSFIATLLLGVSACVEADPEYTDFPSKDVDFSYAVAPNSAGEVEFAIDYYVVSTIQFTNTSAKQGPSVTWDFGDGQTSTEANPVHKYAKAGRYQVKLTVEGVGSRTYPIMIYDIAPVLSISSQSAEVLTCNDVEVEFNIFLPNPENKEVKYEWTFPEGAIDAQGQPITKFEGMAHADGTVDYPGKIRFKNIGSQRIILKAVFDTAEGGENRTLEESYVNVQVGADKPYKTLYYAALDGNIKAYKLIPESALPEGTKNMPFDMGVSSGSMPFTLCYAESEVVSEGEDATVTKQGWVYILDAGKQYTYINDEGGVNGDGKINVMSVDGKSTNLFVSNVGKAAFDDPFFGFVDGDNLLYTDRNTGIRKMSLDARGQVEANDYLVKNDQLGYYNRDYSYGAISTSVCRDKNGTYWWGKCYNGQGIFRFNVADLGNLSASPHPVLLANVPMKAFTLDEKRGKLYVWRTKSEGGFYVYPLPKLDAGLDKAAFEARFLMDADPVNSTDNEGVYCTQMAVDSDNGNVYFGFNKESSDQSTYTTGLKVYNSETQKVESFYDNTDRILGIVINENATKLF